MLALAFIVLVGVVTTALLSARSTSSVDAAHRRSTTSATASTPPTPPSSRPSHGARPRRARRRRSRVRRPVHLDARRERRSRSASTARTCRRSPAPASSSATSCSPRASSTGSACTHREHDRARAGELRGRRRRDADDHQDLHPVLDGDAMTTPRRRRPETGYTLIELIVSLTILATITGALDRDVPHRQQRERQRLRAHPRVERRPAHRRLLDRRRAGGRRRQPGHRRTDTDLGVSTSDDRRLRPRRRHASSSASSGSEWSSRNPTTTVDSYTTRVAALRLPSRDQRARAADVRRRHSTGIVTLATRVASAPTVTCDGSTALPGAARAPSASP